MKKVLLVSGSDYSQEVYEGLLRVKTKANIEFSLLSDGSFTPKVSIFKEHYKFDLRKTKACLEFLTQKNLSFDAVTQKSSEWLTPLVALLQKQYGCLGTDPKVAFTCRSKFQMRKAFEGLPSVPYKLVKNKDELFEAINSLTPPVVAKPIGGNASFGTFLISENFDANKVADLYENSISYLKKMSIDQDVFTFSNEELETYFNEKDFVDTTTDYLVEKFIKGKNISIDSLVYDHGIAVLAIAEQTRMPPPFFLQTSEIIPANLTHNELQAALSLNEMTIRKLGVSHSPVHLEMILTESGPVLLELGVRIGGDNIHHSILTTTGIHVLETQILSLLGLLPEIHPTSKGYSATEYLHTPFTSKEFVVNGLVENKDEETIIIVTPGDKVAPPPYSFDFLGYVNIFDESRDTAIKSAFNKRNDIINDLVLTPQQ